MKENVSFPELENVAPLERFDPTAFLDEDPAVQSVCDFVLALALIFNDFKDLLWALRRLRANAPDFEVNFHETPQWGHHTGMDHHLHRLRASLMVELMRLLDTTRAVNRPLFQEILHSLEPAGKVAWADLTKPDSELREMLANVRDKIAYHYFASDNGSQKVLGDGYRAAFQGTGRTPLLSRGSSPLATRFYFADAAAHEMDKLIRTPGWIERFDGYAQSIFDVLFSVVVQFLRLRGREPNSEGSHAAS